MEPFTLNPKGQPRAVSVREGALPPALFARLRRRVRRLGSERLRQTILEIRPLLPIGDAIAGVEWWLSRMRTTDVRVDFHRDWDERLALTHGRIVHPRLSAVLFVNRVRGGLLAVTRQSPWPENPSCAPRKVDWELVQPRPNRLAFFSGNLTHGVLDANNQIPNGRIPGKNASRFGRGRTSSQSTLRGAQDGFPGHGDCRVTASSPPRTRLTNNTADRRGWTIRPWVSASLSSRSR